jgi:hypothetical protein
MKNYLVSLFLFAALAAQAQSYSIGWYKIAGGGGGGAGTNGGTVYSINGSMGQQDAGPAMTGGGYSLTSGFWSLIAVVQSPGMPMLAISRSGNSVVISWPDTGSYVLQQNSSLGASGWSNSNYAVSTNNGASSVTLTPPPGNLFFRLSQ